MKNPVTYVARQLIEFGQLVEQIGKEYDLQIKLLDEDIKYVHDMLYEHAVQR